jgi:Putative MetA-pathway of phenol degradation
MHAVKQKLPLLAGLLLGLGSFGTQQTFAQQTPTPAPAQDADRNAQDRSETEEIRESEQTPAFVSDSNTGYVDSALIGTRFRLRGDGGFHVHSPDRAEFFYGACGCARVVPDPPDNFPNANGNVLNPDAPGPVGTVIPGAILTSPLIETDLNYQELGFDFEYAFKRNFSLFVEVPLRFVDGKAIGSESGLGDLRAGLKVGLLRNPDHQLTFQLRGYFPTGDSEKGLGTDHSSIEPGLLYYGRLNGPWTLAAELRYWAPIDGTTGRGTGINEDYAGDVLRYGFGFGRDFELASGGSVTPIVEVVGWSVLGGLALTSADGTPAGTQVPGFGYRRVDGETITNLKLGLRFGFRDGGSVYVGYGTALSDEEWYDDIVRIEYRARYRRRSSGF